MNSSKLSPLLVEAKDQYIRQLAEIFAPFVVHAVNSAYQYAKKHAGFGKSTIEFQRKLKEIPQWNASVIAQHVTAIASKYPFFSDLVAACFVSYVKIMSSVKIHANKPNIRLRLPTDDAFVHRVFSLAAKEFYVDPALVKASREIRMEIVRRAVEGAVRDLLPIHDILKAYLGNTVDQEGVDTNEIDESDESPEPSPQPSPQPSSAEPSPQPSPQASSAEPSPQASPQPSPQPSPQRESQVVQVPMTSPSVPQERVMAELQKILASAKVAPASPGAFVTPLGFDDAAGDKFFK
jgi:hypothetical protein